MQVILLRAIERGGGGPPETNVTGVYPPLGLLTLAACLREAKHPVHLLDAHALKLEADAAAREVPANFTGLLCFSTTTLNWHRTYALIRACRERAPDATILVGGPHLDLYPTETAAMPEVDLVCIGEGDLALPAIARALERREDLSTIPGVAQHLDNEVRFGPPPQVADFDRVPLPAWDLLPLDRYRALTVLHPFGTMVSGRGCPYKCRFCSQRYAGGKYHRMSPERLVREWRFLVRYIGVREIVHFDETFAIGEDYVDEVAERVLKESLQIPNSVRARCDTLTERMAVALARTGTHTVHLGIEAGGDEALARMNKGITVETARTAVAATKAAGMTARGYFMLAYPGDSLADYRATVELARSLPLDLASFTLTVLNPGTPIYEDALAAGDIQDYWAAFARGETVPDKLPRPRHGLGDEKELQRLLKKAYRGFYLRPAVLWRLATNWRLWQWLPSWLGAYLRRGV